MAPQRHGHSKPFGVFNPSFGADKFGFHDLRSISYNFDAPFLYEEAIRRHEGVIARGGALVAETGVHTGRSPRDKFIVADAVTEDAIWWDNCGRISKDHFDALLADFIDHAKGKEIFAQDLYGGADPAFRIKTQSLHRVLMAIAIRPQHADTSADRRPALL